MDGNITNFILNNFGYIIINFVVVLIVVVFIFLQLLSIKKEIKNMNILIVGLAQLFKPNPKPTEGPRVPEEEQEALEAQRLMEGEEEPKQKEPMEFYDLKKKVKFTTTDYETMTKNKRRFAITIAPSGVKSCKMLKKE